MAAPGQCVPLPNVRDRLSDRYHVTVILRLVLDRLQHLVYGEIIDAEGRSSGHFASWAELPGAVQRSLSAAEPPPAGPEDRG
jgi:hypothetical protein